MALIFIMIALIGMVLIIIVARTHGSSNTKRVYVKSKNQLANNNKYILENSKKIEKIFDERYKELEPIKRRMLISVLVFFIALISVFIVKNEYYTYISLGLPLIILGISYYEYNTKSNKKFIEITKEVIHDYNNDLEYIPNSGFSSSEYALCHFPEKCDIFSSEDMITNSKNGFLFSDITIKSEYRDNDGDSHYTTEYEGSLARMYIKDVECKIFLGGINFRNYYTKDYVEVKFENDEFNDLFKAYTDNELLAYKILTPDVMEEFVNIKNDTYGDIDIRIINNKLYIRFLSGDGFDSSALTKNEDRESLCKSIAVLEEVMKTMEKVKKIIDNKNDN